MIAAVVAADEGNGIGRDGDMLISIPEDLKMFKELTYGHVVIMGRKTFEALPCGPLPGRINVVITSKAKGKGRIETSENGREYYICDLDAVKRYLAEKTEESKKHCFVIGGGVIYKELLPWCERVYLTRIHAAFEGADTYFPDMDKQSGWRLRVKGETKSYRGIEFCFCEYEKTQKPNDKIPQLVIYEKILQKA